jgi:predicted anti-sigma-YlaC factor YlaD
VSAELDGRLSEFEQALLEGHLAGCAGCASFRRSAMRISRELRSAPLEELECSITVRRARRRLPLRIAPAVAALAVTAVGLGSLITTTVVRPGSEVERQVPRDSSEELSLENGPLNMEMLLGARRDHIVAEPSGVSARRLERLLNTPHR